MSHEEKVSPHFNVSDYLLARRKTIEITQLLAGMIAPGMDEAEAHQLAKKIFADYGVTKLWHPSKIRFGKNTLKSFKEESDPGLRLGEGDLFFLDLGPVIAGHEGDYGETFRCGGGSDALIRASRDIFTLTEKVWREHGYTGKKLYDVATIAARERGYKLDMRSDGHRLGDFPHAVFHRGGLGEFAAKPVPGLWILEIHLADESRDCGAFFEDILGLSELEKSLF
jgi:Xaa-Pro aminopeptidase